MRVRRETVRLHTETILVNHSGLLLCGGVFAELTVPPTPGDANESRSPEVLKRLQTFYLIGRVENRVRRR